MRFRITLLTQRDRGRTQCKKGRWVDLIVQVVLVWAKAQPKIRAVALVGSHARGTARPDSDIDVMARLI